jgi:WD40 repeat protein
MADQRRDERKPPDALRDKAGIFVSYARNDEAIVERLIAALRGHGRDVWVDVEDIRGTEEWARAIDAGIDSSDAVVFVLSPSFLGSGQCQRELDYALDKGKRLVPVVADAVEAREVPTELARLNWIAVGDVDALESALDTDLEWVRTHTDLLVRAVAWEARGEDRGLLLRGRPLADAERFLANADAKEPPPAPLHTRYVLAGRRAATRRQRGTLAAVTTFLVIAVALAVLAFVQRNRAIHESNLASSRELAGASSAVAVSNPELARLLAIAAMGREQTPEAVAALRRAVAQPAIRMRTEPRTSVESISPDGRRVVVRRRDQTLDVLDVTSGRRVASRLEGTRDGGSVALGRGGRWLAATTEGGDVLVWDLERGRRQRIDGAFSDLEFSRDGSRLLLVERSGAVAVVDPRDPAPAPRVRLPATAGQSSTFPKPTAVFAPRGDLVVTWNEDSPDAQIWDASTGALRSTLRHGANLTDAAISPEGTLALTAGRDMTVRFWNPRTGVAARRPNIAVPPPDDDDFDVDIAAASFSPQSEAVVTTLTVDHLQVWRTSDAKLLLNRRNAFDYLMDQGFGPEAPYLVTGSGVRDWVHDRKVIEPPMRVTLLHADGSFESVERRGDQPAGIWSGETESTLVDLPRAASDVSFGGDNVAIAYADGTVEVRDARSGRALLRVPRGGPRAAASVELSPDGRTLAVSRHLDASGRRGAELWRLGRRGRKALDRRVSNVVGFSADAARVLVTTSVGAGGFAVLDVATGNRIGKTFPHRTVLIESTALSPDGQLFVQPNAENSIDVYRVADGSRFGKPLRGQGAVDVAVSPDNKLVATAGDGVIIWDLESGARVATLSHEARVTRVAFSADGRLLLSRAADGTLHVWEATTGAPVALWSDLPTEPERAPEIDAPTVLDSGLDFSPSVTELLRADDGYIYRIPCPACAEPDELLARAKKEARRQLTAAERRQYLHEGD